MNTRDALNILSKGDANYTEHVNDGLLKRSQEYLEMYNQRDADIYHKQVTASAQLPFVKQLKKKIAKIVATPDNTLPIVTRFDLYTGISKIASRTKNDAGLQKLAQMLERGWHEDPMGTLTYGHVSGLIARMKDQFPKSKAVDAIEAECVRVGMHKLPVAKLARLAANVSSQEDYDALIESGGYAGDRPEQIRARALVRQLVAMRTGDSVDSHETEKKDTRTATEFVTDKLDTLGKDAGYSSALDLLDAAEGAALSLEDALDKAAMEMFADGINSAGERVQALSNKLGAWIAEFKSVQSGSQPLSEEQMSHTAKLLKTAEATLECVDGDTRNSLYRFVREVKAQFALDDKNDDEPADLLGLDSIDDGMPKSDEGEKSKPGDGDVTEDEVDSGLDIIEEVQEVAEDIIEDAPEEAQDYIDHEMSEGHTGYPGTAEWGAEEILMEDHSAAPPSDEWLNEELEEIEKMSSRIEDDLLSGKTVKVGSMSILINDQDEVELWNKTSGISTGLENLDRAISDFVKFARKANKTASKKPASKFVFHIAALVDVPCEKCGDINTYEKTADVTDYRCACGHLSKSASVDEFLKVAHWGKSYQITVNFPVRENDPAYNKQAREYVFKMLGSVTKDNMQVIDDNRGCIVVATSYDAFDPERAQKELANSGGLASAGGSVDIKRVAQQEMPIMPAISAPAKAPGAPEIDHNVPAEEAISAALTHYKSTGAVSGPAEAIAQMLKDYKEREDLKTPDNQAAAMEIALQLWGGTGASAPSMSDMSLSLTAQMKAPSIRKPKDHVKVDGLGSDSETQELLPKTKVNTQVKPKGKMSPKSLGKDTSGSDLLPDPGEINERHIPSGKKPAKGLGKDMSQKDPFSTPALGSKPKVSK